MQPDMPPGPELPPPPQPGQQPYQPALAPNPYSQMVPNTSQPHKKGSRLNLWMIISVILLLLLIGAASFGAWAYAGRQDYKDNVDKKIVTAVAVKTKEISDTKDKELAEKEKLPLKTYTGPEQYGSIKVSYPKTWSVYAVQANSANPVDAYFHPDVVPGVATQGVAYALRVQVTTQSYDQAIQQLSGLVKGGKIKSSPYALPKEPKVVGTRFEGQIEPNIQGVMIVLPLRDKTLKIYTESSTYLNDFNTNILPNLDFQP